MPRPAPSIAAASTVSTQWQGNLSNWPSIAPGFNLILHTMKKTKREPAPEVRTAKLHWLNGGEMEKSYTGTIAKIHAEAERVANSYNTTVEVYLLTARAVVNKTVKMEEAK